MVLAQALDSEFLQGKTFIVGEAITAVDLMAFGLLAPLFSRELQDTEKLAMPNVFRWLDRI